jgi:hypothetical protein
MPLGGAPDGWFDCVKTDKADAALVRTLRLSRCAYERLTAVIDCARDLIQKSASRQNDCFGLLVARNVRLTKTSQARDRQELRTRQADRVAHKLERANR